MPKVSVIMPVYNTKEEYFRAAIESVLVQTFNDFELLIVDDCSKSYIKEIVRSYSDERIRYLVLEQNSGAAEARNLAISQAKSSYIAFIDSDDIAYPERLQKQYDYLEQHSDIGCLGTKVKNIGNLADKAYFPTPTKHKDIELWLLFEGCTFCQSSVMLRKSILDENHIRYNSDYIPTEDYALWLDLIGLTKFAVLEECLGEYRYYAENISNQQQLLQQKKGNKAKINALKKYLHITNQDADILNKFLLEQNLTTEEIKHICALLSKIIQRLIDKNFSNQDVCKLFKNHFRKLFLHTRTISGQGLLIKDDVNRYFNLPLGWRLFCFITRGIF